MAMTLDLEMTSCLEFSILFIESKMPPIGPLWAEPFKYVSDVLNMTGTDQGQAGLAVTVAECQRPRAVAWLLPFLNTGFHHVKITLKSVLVSL